MEDGQALPGNAAQLLGSGVVLGAIPVLKKEYDKKNKKKTIPFLSNDFSRSLTENFLNYHNKGFSPYYEPIKIFLGDV